MSNLIVLRNTINKIPMTPQFTAGEASRLAGFKKPWMLAHLEREGIFVREYTSDRRHGRARKYTFVDVMVLRAINRMLELGARPARIKKVIAELGMVEGIPSSRRAAIKMAQQSGTCLFVTAKEAFLLKSSQEVIDLAAHGQLAFGFMIDIEISLRPVIETISAYRKKQHHNWKRDQLILEELCLASGL